MVKRGDVILILSVKCNEIKVLILFFVMSRTWLGCVWPPYGAHRFCVFVLLDVIALFCLKVNRIVHGGELRSGCLLGKVFT